jgi:4-amino-4-deoxy-L-arabinose transferase-like glycosyltransferase
VRVSDLSNRLGAAARRYRAGLILVLALNLAFVALYVWAQGGQTTVVEVSNSGRIYTAKVDGREVPVRFDLDVPGTGTVSLELPPRLPSLPGPSGVDSIVVRENSSGRVLFRDDFGQLRADVWQVVSGSFAVEDGVLVARDQRTPNNVVVHSRSWTDATVRNYTVIVTYKNGISGTIGSHVTTDGGAFYSFELIRDFPPFFDARNRGQSTGQVSADSVYVQPSRQGTLRSMTFMLTRPYPYVALTLMASVVLVALLSLVTRPARSLRAWRRGTDLTPPFESLRGDPAGTPLSFNLAQDRHSGRRGARLGPWSTWIVRRVSRTGLSTGIIAVLVLVAFASTLVLNLEYYAALPHVPDEAAYIFQAKLLAAGHVMVTKPPVPYAFDFYELPFLYENGDKWASFYPFGHPLVLALGERFGAVWAIPSLVGAACVGLTYAIGRRLFDGTTALLAAVLMVASPFFLMQASNFMSHNTAALFVLLCLLFIFKRERPVLYGVIAGLAFGMAVNTRPVTAVAMIPAFGLLMLTYLMAQESRGRAILHTAGFCGGALVMMLAMLAYNYGLTGDPFVSAYDSNPAATFGFNGGHTLETGLRNQQAQLMSLLLVFNGWPQLAGISLVLLPFLLGTRNRWDYFCLLAAAGPIGVYLLYRYSGVFEGPRYWYEAAPFLFLLSARGVQCLIDFLSLHAARLRERVSQPQRNGRLAPAVLVYGALAVLLVYGTGGWLTGADRGWDVSNAHLIPNSPNAMRGLFGVDDRLAKVADRTPLSNALVLVKPCGFFQSANCYGSVLLRNNIYFNGDVVWARYVEGRNEEIITAYPGRRVYVATWDEGATITPYRPLRDARPAEAPPSGQKDEAKASRD